MPRFSVLVKYYIIYHNETPIGQHGLQLVQVTIGYIVIRCSGMPFHF